MMALALGSVAAQDATKPATPTPTPAVPTGISVLWRRSPVPFKGPATLTAGSRSIFLNSSETGVGAFSIDDGKTLWSSDLVSDLPAVVTGTQIAVVSGESIHVLAQDTGVEVWRATIGPATSGLFTLGDRVGAVVASELRTWAANGTAGWRTTLPGMPTTRVILRDGLVYVGIDTPALVALDGATGVIRWQVALKARPLGLTATDDRLFFSDANATLNAYEIKPQAEPAWPPYHLIRAIGAPLVDDKHAYFALLDNSVRAFTRSGGTQRWSKVMTARPAAGPMRVGENLAVALTSGIVVELAWRDGAIIPSPTTAAASSDRLQAAAASPDNGRVYTFTIAGGNVRTLTAWGHPPAKR